MNAKHLKLILALLFVQFSASAQNSILLNYDWEKSPSLHELNESESKESAVYIKHVLGAEILYQEDNSAIEYYMEHVIMHLNDADAVDNNNKVYMVGSKASTELYTIIEKARVIKSSGKIIDLDKDDILEETNEDEGTSYRYFALEGIEIGDEIEYYYIYPRLPKTTGVLQRIQNSNLTREATIMVITPRNLINKFKSYNGFPEMVKDSNYDDRNYYKATATNLPGLKSEKYASYNANRGSVAYYLYKNTANNTSTDYYANVSKYFAKSLNEVNPKKTGITKLMKKMAIDESLSNDQKIIEVENYLKKEIRYLESGYNGLEDVKSILSSKLANELGLLKIYGTIFRKMGINFEVVYTSDRDDILFDEDLECFIFLDNIMLYFPDSKKYLALVGINNRYGFPPGELTNNYGYFTKFLTVAGVPTGVGKIKYIEAIDGKKSVDKIDIELTLNELPNGKVKMLREFSGYNALNTQVFFDYMDEESIKETKEELVKYFDEDMVLDEVVAKNIKTSDFGKKPLILEATFTSDVFVQKAGNNFLINVGKLIGPQAELYQEETRKMPVSNDNNHVYERVIKVIIPEGYEVANLEQLKIDISFDKDGKKDIGFISSYSLDGNTLTINCEEYYYSIDYPVEGYENFEKVINAAADFNKIAIVLKKKG